MPIIAVTLKPIDWPAAQNIVVPFERGTLAMFKQILIGLIATQSDVVFLAEHDVVYDPSHWSFTPSDEHRYFYNLNWLKVDAQTGRAVTYIAKQTSQLCAYRDLLISHYTRRVGVVERHGFSRRQGFEPGSHKRPERIDSFESDVWMSDGPNYDVRHGANLTPSRWSPEEFRSKSNCQGWRETVVNPQEVLGVQQAVA